MEFDPTGRGPWALGRPISTFVKRECNHGSTSCFDRGGAVGIFE